MEKAEKTAAGEKIENPGIKVEIDKDKPTVVC